VKKFKTYFTVVQLYYSIFIIRS